MTNEKVLVDRELLRLWAPIAEVLLKDPSHDKMRMAFRNALNVALAEPAVEPVVWYDGRKFYATPSAAHMDCADIKELRPLYEAQQPAPPADVPMLTNDELGCAHPTTYRLSSDDIEFARNIEQLVRQKASIK